MNGCLAPHAGKSAGQSAGGEELSGFALTPVGSVALLRR